MNGIGERAGNCSLEEIAMIVRTRGQALGVQHGLNIKEIVRTSRLVAMTTGYSVQPNKAVVGSSAFAHESGIHQHGVLSNRATYEIMDPVEIGLEGNPLVLGKHSGPPRVRRRARQDRHHARRRPPEPGVRPVQGPRRPQGADHRPGPRRRSWPRSSGPTDEDVLVLESRDRGRRHRTCSRRPRSACGRARSDRGVRDRRRPDRRRDGRDRARRRRRGATHQLPRVVA